MLAGRCGCDVRPGAESRESVGVAAPASAPPPPTFPTLPPLLLTRLPHPRPQRRPAPPSTHPLHRHPAHRQPIQERRQVPRREVLQRHRPVRDRRRDHVRPRLDPVRDHRVVRTVQLLHPLDRHPRRPRTADPRTHRIQQIRQVLHLRLTRGTLDHRHPLRQRRRRHHVRRPQHRRPIRPAQKHMRPPKPPPSLPPRRRVGCLRHDVPSLQPNPRPQRPQAPDVQVHRAVPDRAPPRHRHLRVPPRRQQRPEHAHPRPHRPHDVIMRQRRPPVVGVQVHRIVLRRILLHPTPQRPQQLHHVPDVRQVRHIPQRHLLLRQQRPRHQRQTRILRPMNPHSPPQRPATMYHKCIHNPS